MTTLKVRSALFWMIQFWENNPKYSIENHVIYLIQWCIYNAKYGNIIDNLTRQQVAKLNLQKQCYY